MALRCSDLEDLSKLKVDAFYREKDWALVCQAQPKHELGGLNEFYDYIEGVREPELAVVKRAGPCVRQRKKVLEQRGSWVQDNQMSRKWSYNFYKREHQFSETSVKPFKKMSVDWKGMTGTNQFAGRSFKSRISCLGCKTPEVIRPDCPNCNSRRR